MVLSTTVHQPHPLTKAMLSELRSLTSLQTDLHFIAISHSVACKHSAFQALHHVKFFYVLKRSTVLGELEEFICNVPPDWFCKGVCPYGDSFL